MLQEYFLAFGFILLAEMGDKTQLLAMAFATKYKVRDVIIGITIGSFFNHLIAVLIGYGLKFVLPLDIIGIFAGAAFLVFGYWSLKTDEDDETTSKTVKYGAIATISLAYFIGELADKTQLAAITLATQATNPLVILLGTVSGMVVSGALAIVIAIWIGQRIPEFYMKIGASVVFILFGVTKLITSIPDSYQTWFIILPAIIVALVIYYLMFTPLYRIHKLGILTSYQETAKALKAYFTKMETQLDSICLTEDVCGACAQSGCLIGYTKLLIKDAKNEQKLRYKQPYKNYKKFDLSKVQQAYSMTLKEIKHTAQEHAVTLLYEICHALEEILFEQTFEEQADILEYVDQLEQIDPVLYQQIISQLKE